MVILIDDGFERFFWPAYPRHVGKKDARSAWTKLAPNDALIERIVAALRWQRQTPAWTKDGGTYIPYPATWLRAERWDDEPFETRPMLGKLSSRMAALVQKAREEP